MEIDAINRFICGNIATSIPKEEGLYIYVYSNNDGEVKALLMEVRRDMGILLAYSDYFFGDYMKVGFVARKYNTGFWTKKITFAT